MLIRKTQVAVEIEAVEGTAETLEAADAFLASNVDFQPAIEMTERDPLRSNLSPWASIPGKRQATVTFDVDLVGTGTAGDSLPFADALKACGVEETLVADTSATYKPASDSVPSVTIGVYMDGKIYKTWGARGTFRLDLANGKPGVIHFTFTGADWSEEDGSMLSGVTYNTTMPPVLLSANFSIDSYAALIDSLSLDAGCEVTLISDINKASGFRSALISSRRPAVRFDPENVLAATHDFLGKWKAGSLMALSATLGSDAGNTIAISAPKIQYQEARLADRTGLSIFDLTGLCTVDAGDDEWQIQIT